MTTQELYRNLKQELERLVRLHHLNESPIMLKSRGLSPEEAIGNTVRRDYPILAGKEVMLQARFGIPSARHLRTRLPTSAARSTTCWLLTPKTTRTVEGCSWPR